MTPIASIVRPILLAALSTCCLLAQGSFHGPSVPQGVGFSPAFKLGYNVSPKLITGFEYYGSVGPVFGFDAFRRQQQQFVPSIDYDFGPDWEFNFGLGIGVTQSTDHLIVKMIVGRRFHFTPHLPAFAALTRR